MPSSSSLEKTLPVGLCGVFSTSNFVRSVKALSSSSRSNFQSAAVSAQSARSGTPIVVAPIKSAAIFGASK